LVTTTRVRQDPYCSLKLEKEIRRTKAVKKGGQHPEWDQEIRFSLLEDTEDVLARTASNYDDEDTPPPVPSKTPTGKLNFNKDRSLRLSCYADDPREAELIGEVIVSLTEVLTKGETDGQLLLMSKM
jgi:neural Wiskott-Aldrich syndrome protein